MFSETNIFLILLMVLFLDPLEISNGNWKNNMQIFNMLNILFIVGGLIAENNKNKLEIRN